jgi:hypothetical protein
MIGEMRDQFELRTREDAPTPKPSNKTADLLNQEDIQRLMQSDRVRQFIGVIIGETTKNLREELLEEVRSEVREEIRETIREEVRMEMLEGQKLLESNYKEFEEAQKKRDEEQRKRDEDYKEILKKRDVESMSLLKELIEQRKKEYQERQKEQSKGFFSRLFGGK